MSLDRFRKALEEAVGEVAKSESPQSLVFFIDEMDRCRPTFAIELLERIKHLFDVTNIVFVLSIDKSQLEAITAAVYGDRIDATEYLRRFIELEFGLPAFHLKEFTRVQMERFGFKSFFEARKQYQDLAYDFEHFVETFSLLSRMFDLSLRARERCMTRLAVVLVQTREKEFLDPLMVAFLLVLRVKRLDLYKGLLSGSIAPREVVAIVKDMQGSEDFSSSRLSSVIEAYLILGDVVSERGDSVWGALQKLAEEQNGTSEEIEARKICEKRRFITGTWGRSFSTALIAKKVDLASMIGDER